MHTLYLIYSSLLILLIADLLFMFLNFKYSFYMQIKEREAMYDRSRRRELNNEVYNEYGFWRVFIKGFIYYGWFVLGFFTQYWPYHLGIFLFNFFQESRTRGKIIISKFSYFLKLSAYLFVYLSVIYSILNLWNKTEDVSLYGEELWTSLLARGRLRPLSPRRCNAKQLPGLTNDHSVTR